MGGIGSGNWYRWDKRTTVEESLTLSSSSFRGRLYHGAAGTLTWTWHNGASASVGYTVVVGSGVWSVALDYRWGGKEDILLPTDLQFTPLPWGGERIWFTCPLSLRGVPCGRRCGRLHLPPGARLFGCRLCHGLTYRSCQEAHQAERVGRWLGLDAEDARTFGRRWTGHSETTGRARRVRNRGAKRTRP